MLPALPGGSPVPEQLASSSPLAVLIPESIVSEISFFHHQIASQADENFVQICPTEEEPIKPIFEAYLRAALNFSRHETIWSAYSLVRACFIALLD